MKRNHLLLAVLPLLAGCAAHPDTAPVDVTTPGLPSPELALQHSIDRVHSFMGSLNQRLDVPSPVAAPSGAAEAALAKTAPAAAPSASPALPARAATPQAARPDPAPIYGKGGIVWFAYADGSPVITCAAGDLCIVRLQAGETASQDAAVLTGSAGWRADVVRGTKGVHAGWAVAISATSQATEAVLRLVTNRRSYILRLTPRAPGMRTVAFAYGANDPVSQPEPAEIPASGTHDRSPPDFSYRMSGAEPSWKPMRVYRDGGRTYIQFPPGGINAAPRLVIVSPQASGVQDYATTGDSYIVNRPVDDALLIGREAGSPTIRIVHGGKQ
ncbi:TrbG/VirB9 family P-type conjugative transfer protein [Komagataeibacter rhaeticus]|uniref:TrbG/VirB9 family P-type conjugative transfer protein n=1 Tax=Komagataeibacter rhaeticus TaxID=215221 RepID=UPI001CD48C27|nr:TrbG/VirB9 family P-type conjugative transfer protein [Komagataeibacter rhaeticus]